MHTFIERGNNDRDSCMHACICMHVHMQLTARASGCACTWAHAHAGIQPRGQARMHGFDSYTCKHLRATKIVVLLMRTQLYIFFCLDINTHMHIHQYINAHIYKTAISEQLSPFTVVGMHVHVCVRVREHQRVCTHAFVPMRVCACPRG